MCFIVIEEILMSVLYKNLLRVLLFTKLKRILQEEKQMGTLHDRVGDVSRDKFEID